MSAPDLITSLHKKNMEFFRQTHPNLYRVLKNTKHDHVKLMIDGERGDVDLSMNDRLVYQGSGIGYATQEYQTFINEIGPGKLVTLSTQPKPKQFFLDRLAHNRLRSFAQRYAPATDSTIRWRVPSFYPQLVVLGVGLGLHITQLVENNNIEELIIFERDPVYWLMSTYVTDWAELFSKQQARGHQIRYSIATREGDAYPAVWNMLTKSAPHFPFATLFYNHRKTDFYDHIIQKLKKEKHQFVSMWGQYDDELNQLNNIFHNIINNQKKIPASGRKCEIGDLPVIIVGSGPSLDRHIESIKKLKNSCLIVSAGTALTALLNNGITPHLHVESESDYNTFAKITDTGFDDELATIPSIIAAQCNPHTFDILKTSAVYFKSGSVAEGILENKQDTIEGATPTCSNAAFGLMAHFGANNIHLVGTDFGYYDKNYHHSKSAIHYQGSDIAKKLENQMKKYNQSAIEVKGYKGPIYTYGVFQRAIMRLENDIRAYKKRNEQLTVHNHSDGAWIVGTEHSDDIQPATQKANPDLWIQSFLNERRAVPVENLEKLKNTLIDMINETDTTLGKLLRSNNKLPPKRQISMLTRKINTYVAHTLYEKYGSQSILINGSITQCLLLGLSYALTMDESETSPFIKDWKRTLIELVGAMKTQTKDIVEQDHTEKDIRISYSIRDSLPDGLE